MTIRELIQKLLELDLEDTTDNIFFSNKDSTYVYFVGENEYRLK